MANTDPRYKAKRFQGAAAPLKYAAKGHAGGSAAASQRAHDESNRKQPYSHKVICTTSPTARG